MCANGGETIEWQPVQTDGSSTHSSLSSTTEVIESGMPLYQWHVADQLARSLKGEAATICSGDEAFVTLGLGDDILNLTAISSHTV